MKDLKMIVWITQLGLTVAIPLAGFVLLGAWLHESRGWGAWTVWVGILLGLYAAVDGFRASLKILDRMGERKKDPDPPDASTNDRN